MVLLEILVGRESCNCGDDISRDQKADFMHRLSRYLIHGNAIAIRPDVSTKPASFQRELGLGDGLSRPSISHPFSAFKIRAASCPYYCTSFDRTSSRFSKTPNGQRMKIPNDSRLWQVRTLSHQKDWLRAKPQFWLACYVSSGVRVKSTGVELVLQC